MEVKLEEFLKMEDFSSDEDIIILFSSNYYNNFYDKLKRKTASASERVEPYLTREQTKRLLDKYNSLTKKQKSKVKFYDGFTVEQAVYASDKLNTWVEKLKSLKISPFEKYILAYNFVTSFAYNEDEKNKNNSRDLFGILSTDKIVCYGYSSLLNALLEAIGIKTMNLLEAHIGAKKAIHSTQAFKLVDPKYNINGIYFSDPCFDSGYKNIVPRFSAKTFEEYKALKAEYDLNIVEPDIAFKEEEYEIWEDFGGVEIKIPDVKSAVAIYLSDLDNSELNHIYKDKRRELWDDLNHSLWVFDSIEFKNVFMSNISESIKTASVLFALSSSKKDKNIVANKSDIQKIIKQDIANFVDYFFLSKDVNKKKYHSISVSKLVHSGISPSKILKIYEDEFNKFIQDTSYERDFPDRDKKIKTKKPTAQGILEFCFEHGYSDKMLSKLADYMKSRDGKPYEGSVEKELFLINNATVITNEKIRKAMKVVENIDIFSDVEDNTILP